MPVMWRKRLSNLLWITLLILAVGTQVWEETQKNRPERPESPPVEAPSKPPTPPSQKSARGFTVLTGCQLSDHRDNDGDSFKIRHGNDLYELRLYFVDAPEKRLHQYNGERLDHQGRYFGHLSRQDTLEIGLAAKAFTENLLRTQPFRVETRWQPVFDSGRHYAFLFFENDGEELSEKLIRQGLARIYTEGTDLPDGRKKRDFERHLKTLETGAKAKRLGGWKR
jgi:endonuclease YncB( thermonuclease family)